MSHAICFALGVCLTSLFVKILAQTDNKSEHNTQKERVKMGQMKEAIAIVRCDKDTCKPNMRYNSIGTAARANGVYGQSISRCIDKTQYSSAGYRWVSYNPAIHKDVPVHK